MAEPQGQSPEVRAKLMQLREEFAKRAEMDRRRQLGQQHLEDAMKKTQPLRPLGQADTDLEYLSASKGGRIQHKWHGGPIVDTLVNTFPSLAPVANAIGATKVGLSEKELPTDNMYWDPNDPNNLIGNDSRGDVNPMLGVPRSTQPTDLPKSIKMYRADPTGKYGGKEGLETLPQPRFDVGGDRYHNRVEDPTISDVYGDSSKAIQQLYRYARLNGAANKYGYPSLSPEDVAAMALKEGRSDLGYNAVNLGHPDELKFNKMLRDTYNLTLNDQNFLAALFAKQRVADKFKIPFANAWNGTGVNDAGQSGKDYAKNYEHHKKAALHPNNQQLMELVNRAIEDGKKHGLPLRENSIKDSMRHYIPVPYKAKGGVIDMDRMRLELMNKGGVLPRKKRDANLKKFLSDSQIKQRLYHATPKSFSEFKPGGDDPTVSGKAIWMSADPKKQPAAHNLHNYFGSDPYKEGVNVMPLHVKAKAPLVLDNKTMIEWARKAFANGSNEFPELLTPKWINAVRKEGYDSIHLADPYDYGDPHEVIMFEPNKIKSAIGNRGTYDINDPDINKAEGGAVTHAHHLNIASSLDMSKIRNEDGSLKTVYHGTPEKFDKFSIDEDKRGVGGIWFTDSGNYAYDMSKGNGWDSRKIGSNGRVISANLASENPMIFDVVAESQKLAKDIGVDLPSDSLKAQELLAGTNGWDSFVSDLVKDAKNLGHDSLVIKNFNDGRMVDSTAYVIFDPSKIVIKKGGATHAHHLDIEERPL